jgi:hypothetical protein
MKHLDETQAKSLIFLKRFVLTVITISVLKYAGAVITTSQLISKVKAVIQVDLL